MEFKKYAKLKKVAYYAVIAGALFYEGLIGFADSVIEETFKEKTLLEGGVVWVSEQQREFFPSTVYRVTAFEGNRKLYDSGTGFKFLISGCVKKAGKALENSLDN